ncbi:MAG: hypothetical protein ACK5LK_05395 [Chthoniobacterales bacterium]
MAQNLEVLVIIPIIILLALSFVRLGKKPPQLKIALGTGVLIFLSFLTLRAIVPDEWLWRNSEVDRKTRWLQKHLKKTPEWETRPVVILLGSSVTYYGIDAEYLERELTRLGTPAMVLSFCMPGDNHHERLYMLEVFLRKIGAQNREKLMATHVMLLEEVFDEYDRNPLYRMEKESGTERARLFLHPRNALKAWRAYARTLQEGDGDISETRATALLAEHVLLNRFAVGAFSKMQWPEHRSRITPPFFALEGQKNGFDYERTIKSLQLPAKNLTPLKVPYPQWQVWQEHLHEFMDSYVDAYGFYGVPTLEAQRVEYQKIFFNNLPSEVMKIPNPNSKEMAYLMHSKFWFDGVHFTGEGAQNVTSQMAAQLSMLLKKNDL